ncbi:MAG: response regulator [Acidobacteria bacterium]|uniref:Response regulator n=1 Tax=Candidatus Polarisedimenticola svalbardensis TaxID=2886004 RepID=A0A8J6Y235_9BACT|nr:response regulator [Candidatus Polarisedimenticola svalbardensis]
MTEQTIPTGPRILIVDDEVSVREILADGLKVYGFETVTAGGAAAALKLFHAGSFDLVLSDIEMPEMTGIQLLKELKAGDREIDVVMVTGVIDTDTAVNAIRDGASDYVTKPFNLEEVRIVVQRTLEKRRLIRENRAYQQGLEQLVQERTAALRETTDEVERLYVELQESYESTLQAMVTALDFRDNETQGHSLRVVEYTIRISRSMGIVEPELGWIRRGALLHDVGKIGVPDAILRKPGKLDDDEWLEMRKHPEHGYQMLRHIRFLAPALDIVLCHQERFDGSGYPRGLKEGDIPLGARIFAVVDCFDAMTSNRPYRAALPIEKASDEIRRYSGSQFDPTVAAAFLEVPVGVWKQIREDVHREVSAMAAGRRLGTV